MSMMRTTGMSEEGVRGPTAFSNAICGIIPPMITPLLGPNSLDVDGLERLIEHILRGGVHGLFILGTTGEGPSLSYRLRREVIDRTCDLVHGRVPVLVGVTDTSLVETVRLSKHAARAGAQAVVVAPPFYFPIGEVELLCYVRRLLKKLPLPVLLYNMPSHTKLAISAEAVRELMDLSQVVGLKDSSSDVTCFRELREYAQATRPDFSLLIGPEHRLAEMLPLGAHGGVCGGANLLPRLFVGLFNAVRLNDLARTAALQSIVLRLAAKLYAVGPSCSGSSIRSVKTALAALGVCSGLVASPLLGLSDADRLSVRDHLAEFGEYL